ncbi:MAG TPA: rhodanese-like domain-containing protein, partial [Steroidobacteraceae bacterium]|nr:rhodanese-like domain-containing protein [Steroidobacteraceae bacterium]
MAATLIDAAGLARHLGDGDWLCIDCRFDLARPEWGAQAFAAAHIPGALYAHLDRDLSGPRTAASGRHPLPDPAALAATFSRFGIDARVQVVACDQGPGAYAARLWWLLRWLGHEQVAVLDGGFGAWERAGLAVTGERTSRPARRFEARAP